MKLGYCTDRRTVVRNVIIEFFGNDGRKKSNCPSLRALYTRLQFDINMKNINRNCLASDKMFVVR